MPASAARWTNFVVTLLGAVALLSAAFLATAFLIDPYDTGRSPLHLKDGVRPQGPRTAAPSRGRDPAFNAAIFGNSHVQLLSPERLDGLTGLSFVSLIAPASGPKEGLTTMDWFLRHRTQPAKAMIVGIDATWCTPNPDMPNNKPFPFWLFSRSLGDYLGGLMRYDLLEEVTRRFGYLLSRNPDRARADGFWDYEAGYRDQGYETNPELRAKLREIMEVGGGNVEGPFPAAAALEKLMASAPAGTALILLRPPAYTTALPRPGSRDAAADAACRKAFADFAARRPRTALLDWRVDRPEMHDSNLFFDHTHYRQPIARLIEADLARAIRALD